MTAYSEEWMKLERQRTNQEVKSMKKLCVQSIWFWGSEESHNRLVYEKEDGTLWCIWYGQLVQVENRKGSKHNSAGWWTVDAY